MSGSFIGFIYFTGKVFSGLNLLMLIISLVVLLFVTIFISGYQLDIIKIACEQDDEMPVFNPKENIKNGLKVFLLYIVFYVIGGLILTISSSLGIIFLSLGKNIGISIFILTNIIALIVCVLMTWIFSMSLCRIAYHESLDEGLSLRKAYNDLRTIGLLDMLIYVIVMGLIFSIIIVLSLVVTVSLIQTLNDVIFAFIIVFVISIITAYLTVVSSRAIGLLYSKVVFGE